MIHVIIVTDTENDDAIVAVIDRTKLDARQFMIHELMTTTRHNKEEAEAIVTKRYRFSVQLVEEQYRTKKKK